MNATLQLKDGTTFEGTYHGSEAVTTGEVVFNTGMVGYPETMTDPSYRGQILVFTYPMMGNYGIPRLEVDAELPFESEAIHVRAIVVQELVDDTSHATAGLTLKEWCEKHAIPIISGVDTRALTQTIRDHGAILGQIVPESCTPEKSIEDPNESHLVSEVSCDEVREYKGAKKKPTVLLIDCGAKENIIRSLQEREATIIRVPHDYDFTDSDLKFDGILVSNGPGDPKKCVDTIRNLKTAILAHTPIFGICLGCQLLALAAGADTFKLPFGHRGQNQPVIDTETGKALITSQNHGFAVDQKTLPKDFNTWFVNANDDTVEGIKHAKKPLSAVQFHPEAHPGPVESGYLFDTFLQSLHD